MKRKSLIVIGLLFIATGIFAQVAKYRPKVVVLFLGEKNPTFDESRFPDFSFYYTPDLVLKVREKTQGKSTTKKALSSLTGFGAQAFDEYVEEYEGSPKEIIDLKIRAQNAYIFDRNGVFTALGRSLNTAKSSLNDLPLPASKKNAMGKVEYTSLGKLSKDYIKKGGETKRGKRIKKVSPSIYDRYGHPITDFKVANVSGEKFSINKLISNNPLTILYTIQLDKDFDLIKGTENGEGQSGKEYAGNVLGTMAGEKKLNALVKMEEEIFGLNTAL